MSDKNSLKLTKAKQVKVAEELIESSGLSANFYVMLVLSTIVVTLGLLVNNTAVVIGGMLITPLLTPILSMSLGIVIADKTLIYRSAKIILYSVGIVIGISLMITFLFPIAEVNGEISNRLISDIPYFLVAFSAGLAGTFAWSKKDMSAMMPGVAIAVSLLPPLSVIGIGVAMFSFEIVRGSLVAFLFNIFGIVLGSVIIFSLLNFHKAKKETVKAVKDEIREEEQKKEEKLKQEIKEELKKEGKVKEEIKKELKEEIKKKGKKKKK